MRNVLALMPSMQPPGGGNAVAAWIVEALIKRHQVSVLTWTPVEIDAVNAYYGTSITATDIVTYEIPAAIRRPFDWFPTPLAFLKASFVLRRAKQIAGAFDVVICPANETDLPERCIQYVYYPARLRPRPRADIRWYHPALPFLTLYYRACERIAQLRPERVGDTVPLANSSWTARLLRGLYGDGF